MFFNLIEFFQKCLPYKVINGKFSNGNRLALQNGGLNVRKSLKTQFSINSNGGPPRKTLMHKMGEQLSLNDSKENVGFQNSQFNLKTVDGDLARLGRIHLILEHLLTIKLNLNLENGKNCCVHCFLSLSLNLLFVLNISPF